MTARTYPGATRSVRWLAAPLLLVLLSGVARAQVRLEIPGGLTLPYYMQGYEDDKSGWTASIFYRPPNVVPVGYNLLTPAPDFSIPPSPLTVEGFALLAPGSPVPRQVFLREAEGGTVPIFFAPLDAIRAAISDGELTIGELSAITPFVGYADSYHEVFQPQDARGNYQIDIVASGVLQDGRWFLLHCEVNASNYNVSIWFGP